MVKCKQRHTNSYHIVKTYTPSFKKNLSRKAIDKCKPDLQKIRIVYYSNILQGIKTRFFPSFAKRDTPTTHLQHSWKCFGLNPYEKINDKPDFQSRTNCGQSSQIREQLHINRKTFKGGNYFQKKCLEWFKLT